MFVQCDAYGNVECGEAAAFEGVLSNVFESGGKDDGVKVASLEGAWSYGFDTFRDEDGVYRVSKVV